jgi:glycerophosphoryl diester phosphodiesterase
MVFPTLRKGSGARERDGNRFVLAIVVYAVIGMGSAFVSRDEARLRRTPVAPPAREPIVVSHRATAGYAPEQTHAAVSACVDLRLGVELDVRRTRDGALVCIHDGDVDRTTDGHGEVAALSLAELRRLDAGSKVHRAFAGERIAQLEEVFALLRDRKAESILVTIDLKVPNLERETVALAERYGVLDQLLFIGAAIDNRTVRERLRAASPEASSAILCVGPDRLDAAIADPTSAWVYTLYAPDAQQVRRVHAAGKKVLMVTADEPGFWAAGRAAGVDALITDRPLECRASFRR